MKILKRFIAGLAAVLIVGLIVGAVVLSLIPSRNAWKAERVNRAVSHLPLGASNAQVWALLKKEGLERSYVSHKEGIDSTSEVSDNGYTSAELSGYSVAIIRKTSGGFIVSGDTVYYFFFDKKGKLLKTTTKDIFTGP